MKNKSTLVQLFLYLIVGAGATIVEWICFYVLNDTLVIHYALSTTIAFCVSTLVNWLLGRLILFKETKQNVFKELLQIYIASIIGLVMNLLIMWFAIDIIGIREMLAKVLATGIVFFWNFIVRKALIYVK